MMRIVGITLVKSEIDIVEPFVLHALGLVDHLLVEDNGSTDGTLEILEELARRNPSVSLRRSDGGTWQQAERMTALMREAALEFHADWVLPLDADEFLAQSPEGLRALLQEARDSLLHVPWRTYAPTGEDDANEANPVLRIRHRLARENKFTSKVIVPGALASSHKAALARGSHVLFWEGKERAMEVAPGCFLAHFPARSVWQYGEKVLKGYYQQVLSGIGYKLSPQYREGFKLLEKGPEAFVDTYVDLAIRYGAPREPWFEPTLELDPLPYLGGSMELTPPIDPRTVALRSMIRYTDELARAHADATSNRVTVRARRRAARYAEALTDSFRDRFGGRRRRLFDA